MYSNGMSNDDLQQRILELVSRPGYQPVKPRVIAKKLGLPPEAKEDVRKAIKRLIKQGKVGWGAKHVVFAVFDRPQPVAPANTNQPPPESAEGKKKKSKAASDGAPPSLAKGGRVTGIFSRTSRGYGFVRPSGVTKAEGRARDILIPERKTKDASSGDLVEVRILGGERGRVSGEIAKVLERDTHQFVGTYFERGGESYVQVDGTVFAQPINVGDPGAKNALAGDKVVIELVRFPSHVHEGEGVITEVLGPRGAPGVDTMTIIKEFGLPEEFPEDVLDNARREAERFTESLEGRLDLTADTIITIDPFDARDFDDAISLTRIDNDHWRLGVHIADVANFVQPGSALDGEAKNRGTSVYLPDRVIPMLPEIISNNLASLQPDKVRSTRTAFIEFTPDGARIGAEVRTSAIQSKRRFTYEEVDEYLADPQAWREKLTPEVFDLLGRMHELAMILRKRRFARGALELHLPELKIDLDKLGRVSGAHVVENTVSHQIIEEFMLAANEAVAEALADRGLFFLRRIHGSPDLRKLKALTEFVHELGIEAESLEDRFEIQRILAEIADRPERNAVNYAVLRSMQKAVYGPQEEGHFALASTCYCHFTSPIRRYPDLTIHRMFDALEQGHRPPQDFDELSMLGDLCSEREQRAESAERELIKVKLLNYLATKIGLTMDAVVTGVEDFGLFVQGVELPAEGLIRVNSLQDDFYQYDDRTHTLAGRRAGNSFRLGDRVRVEIAHVDVDRRELDFRLIQSDTVAKSPSKSPSQKTKTQRKKRKG
jgi:ribonuclease R